MSENKNETKVSIASGISAKKKHKMMLDNPMKFLKDRDRKDTSVSDIERGYK